MRCNILCMCVAYFTQIKINLNVPIFWEFPLKGIHQKTMGFYSQTTSNGDSVSVTWRQYGVEYFHKIQFPRNIDEGYF